MQTNFGWNFDNTYSRLPKFFFAHTEPTPVSSPSLVIVNEELATFLGLDANALQSKSGTSILAGNTRPKGGLPLTQAYAGHQFGHFTMLGDGRAILLGEQITPNKMRYDLQLKGSGPTPYSRSGDGRATLGPMLREYLISEAMFALGIPTTRGLAVVTTGENIQRETLLPGAILARVATSHLRVGTFQYAAHLGSKENLQILADYAIRRHYPHVANDTNKYQAFLREVIQLQARLISQWMLVGFIHGVMNTDNMTISGETIDYGPCAFMDNFDPATVFSSIDRNGRYAYANQPQIAGWNLARLADTLLPLLAPDQEQAVEIAEEELKQFSKLYDQYYLAGMGAKLGFLKQENEDKDLVRNLLQLMAQYQADYTNTFLELTWDKQNEHDLTRSPDFIAWKGRWQTRLQKNAEPWIVTQERMKQNNPAIIPRNYRVENVLKSAMEKEDYAPFEEFLTLLKKPFDHSEKQAQYNKPPMPSNIPYRTFCGT